MNMAFVGSKCGFLWCVLILVYSAGLASAQEQVACYGPGSIAASVILTFIFTVLLLGAGYFLWRKYRVKKEQLILETDPERGKTEFAFDNPGFKDTSLLPVSKSLESTKLENTKSKWNQWSPLSALTTKSEKRKTVDDTALEANEVKVVALRSHDFTGLGFNICGNMKEGIFIKDILHRGPAFESGKLNPGDRINSVTISFEHMVYEDALTILSYASPYEVMIEAKGGKLIHNTPGQGGQPSHPVYRSSSCADLYHVEKSSKKKLFGDDFNGSLSSNYSSLQKSRSNMTTLERKESKSPRQAHPNAKKAPAKHLTPEQLKSQLEQRILADHQHNLKAKDSKSQRVEIETQKTENKHHKFGIRVLPLEQQQKSPKILEQNENNMNIEKNSETEPVGIDEVDELKRQAPPVKKREKKPEETPEKAQSFERNSLNGSGIKRDEHGIPQEIPNHMFNAAVAARKNRRNSEDFKEEDDSKTPKRKEKAPSPPAEMKTKDSLSKAIFDEIKLINEDAEESLFKSNRREEGAEKQESDVREEIKDYNSDSDVETDNQSSVNTIELNSSDITIHQTEEEERQNRRTASTGDLTKLHKSRKTSSGTLERAQSLDITDTGIPSLSRKRKGGLIEDMQSDEDLFGKVMIDKEPRLSLILDGLTTFQRNRLKKSTEWGNLEDAILKFNQEDEGVTSSEDNTSLDNFKFSFGDKSPEFDALVNKINEIKRESLEIEIPPEIAEIQNTKTEKKIKNQIWPSFENEQTANGTAHVLRADKGKQIELELNEKKSEPVKRYDKRQQVPTAQDRISPPSVGHTDYKTNVPEKITLENTETTDTGVKRRQLKPVAVFDIPTPEYKEEAKIAFSSIQLNSKGPEKVNTRQRVPEDLPVIPPPSVPEEAAEKVPETLEKVLNDEWNTAITENIVNTSPPPSLEIDVVNQEPRFSGKVEEVNIRPAGHSSTTLVNRSEEVLSKIPLLNSMVKNQKEEALKKPVLSTNNTDETKTVVTYNTRPTQPNLLDVTQNFLYTEQLNSSQDDYTYSVKPYDTNISDDIKVSRHSQGSLERLPKSDDAKSEDSLKHVSNVNVTNVANGDTELHSLELSINEPSELYTTALDSTVTTDKEVKNDSKITISTPDLIKNVTLAEAISTLNNDVTIRSPTSLTVEIPKDVVEVTENKFSTVTESPESIVAAADKSTDSSNSSKSNSTLTYITEIQVLTPSNTRTNISEIEITPDTSSESSSRNLDSEFENYVKNFESKLERFENNIQDFDKNLEEFIKEEPTSIILNEKVDETELHKIQEIAEEQLKKLPEMRFTTSSYEAVKVPEKRQSQIEILRSNFEKPPKPNKPDVAPKSRIPIATTMKTPPMSPERRDSRNLDMEHDKALLELMSSSVTSTPYTTSKYQMKSPSKNVTVTSIRSNSKIPSGLPTLSSSRPPIAPRRIETSEGNVVQVSTNGNMESSFKQWVFNPSNVTNVMVTENKQDKY
ncbi:muscle M-line assembly protein unc-89-like isoform X2 [Anoplophora glabripennis]|uniref:muscle M-line assembly protein unc-89-like isoform X2 n=1 Tax=Anoplophora glabripennis TaxID=217634 RepID=UPI000874AA5F|nr:muscle M-line assembly protein unc-89-like isoform X2 [Anoplophora glabripennis]